MNDEYTPTDEEVRAAWINAHQVPAWGGTVDIESRPKVRIAEWYRWLEAHDAEIRADQIETDAEIAADVEESVRGPLSYSVIANAIRAQLAPRPPAPELIPGVMAQVDALSIYRKG